MHTVKFTWFNSDYNIFYFYIESYSLKNFFFLSWASDDAHPADTMLSDKQCKEKNTIKNIYFVCHIDICHATHNDNECKQVIASINKSYIPYSYIRFYFITVLYQIIICHATHKWKRMQTLHIFLHPFSFFFSHFFYNHAWLVNPMVYDG